MDPENKDGNGTPTIESLQEQIANLNKGIAGYRDTAGKSESAAKAAAEEAKAAKAEVERLKKVIEEASVPDDNKDDDKLKLSPEDEKRLEAWAKKNNFVSKKELEEERARMFNESIRNVEAQAINEFLEAHPEYNDDEAWKKVTEQFGQYKQPTSITGYRTLLNKIHKELKGEDDIAAKARADQELRKRLGLGGGSQSSPESDTTFEQIRERYPNLSEDQIRTRLEEINQLATARAEKAKKRGR